jgi:hypothetical protein
MPEKLMQMYGTMTAAEQKEIYDFAVFLFSRKTRPQTAAKKKSYFGALKNKITYIASDFDEPLEDFSEYM